MRRKNKLGIFLTYVIASVFILPSVVISGNFQKTTLDGNIFENKINQISCMNSEKVSVLYSADTCPLSYSSSEHSLRTPPSEYNNLNLERLIGDTFYAYNVFDQGAVLPQGPVSFQSDNPGVITSLKITSSGSFISGGTWADGIWFGCEYGWYGQGDGQLWTIDEITGDMTLIGGGGASLNGLAYNPFTGLLYGCSGTNLYIINMSNGNQTLVGPFISGSLMIGIAFDGEGRLYGENLDDTLHLINVTTGKSTIIGPLGMDINYAQDMAYDIDNSVLYLAAFTIPDYESGLYICNVTTGACTLVGNFQGNAEIDGFAIPYTPNLPPTIPELPLGPSEGVVGVTYTFSTKTNDPDGHKVFYNWNWDDGVYSGWLGPYNSGETVYGSHSWIKNGTYNITVQAKDIFNWKSGWSDPKTISIIEKAFLEIDNITGGLFRVNAVIKNTGGIDAIGINWSINLDGGFILLGKESSGRMMSIPPGGEQTVSSDYIVGFGRTVIMVSVETTDSIIKTGQDAIIFLFFIKLTNG